jgi:protein-tyrosine-phosphatase
MDRPVYMALALLKTIPKEKLYNWEIPDPSGLGIDAYEKTAKRIELELEKFLSGREMEKGYPGPQAQYPE